MAAPLFWHVSHAHAQSGGLEDEIQTAATQIQLTEIIYFTSNSKVMLNYFRLETLLPFTPTDAAPLATTNLTDTWVLPTLATT